MASDIARSIWSTIRGTSAPNRDAVHFHVGGNGHPFVCDFHRCESARLTLGEIETETSRR
jgi:hypothetical protein